jgi:hypothetical protein
MTTPARPVDGQTFAIGVLSVTACVLFVGLLLLMVQPPQPAYAMAMNDRGGDYILCTQQLSTSTEAVIVIDAAAKRMIVYAFDYNNRTLEILEGIPLDRLPRPREAPGR